MLRTTKQCTKCDTIQPISDFGNRPANTDGLKSSCKSCDTLKALNHSRTRHGLLTMIFSSHRVRSKKKKYSEEMYSKDTLSKWLFLQPNFEALYSAWVDSGYKKDLKPSIDRLNDYVGYTLDNIQLVTWAENNAKGLLDRREGRNNKQSKKVLQYTLDGEFITEHHSLSEAGRSSGINFQSIHQAIIGRNGAKQSGGYIWKYKET